MQEKFDKWLYRTVLAILVALLLSAFTAAAMLWSEIEETAPAAGAYADRYPVICAGDVPEDFDQEAYREACRRYDAEHGLVIPLG